MAVKVNATPTTKKDNTPPMKKEPTVKKAMENVEPEVIKPKKTKAPVIAPKKADEAKEEKNVAPKVNAEAPKKKPAPVIAPKPTNAKVEALVVEEAPKEEKPKKPVPKPKKPISFAAMQTKLPPKKPASGSGKPKTVYHVSKRDNDGREWKVFIQESSKVIKLFDTQAEALEYAKQLCKNKDDGSYVILHGLNGKIRKY